MNKIFWEFLFFEGQYFVLLIKICIHNLPKILKSYPFHSYYHSVLPMNLFYQVKYFHRCFHQSHSFITFYSCKLWINKNENKQKSVTFMKLKNIQLHSLTAVQLSCIHTCTENSLHSKSNKCLNAWLSDLK